MQTPPSQQRISLDPFHFQTSCLVMTPNNLPLGSSSSGWLVGVWLLLRVPGEWMISKICIFPPGLITSGFVNGKITSSLALAGGESSRLIQYLRKLHCRAQEAGGRNRLPVSVSAGDNLCRHRLASVELAGKTSPLPWELGKDGIFSLFPCFGSRGAWCSPLCRCCVVGWALQRRGVGWAHSMGILLLFQPSHGCWRENGTC